MGWGFNTVAVIAGVGLAVTVAFQTATDAFKNEPLPGDDKGNQIIRDASSNTIKNLVRGSETIVGTLTDEGGRLADKYRDSTKDALGKFNEESELNCATGEPQVVFGEECKDFHNKSREP